MKTHFPKILRAFAPPAVWLACATTVMAGPRTSAAYSILADTADSGGRRGTSASYTHDGSVGLIAGFSSVSSPVVAVDHGYLGQIADGTIVTSPGNSGPGTLRDTLAAVPSGSTITFAPGLGSITLGSEIVLTKSVIIDASSLSTGMTVNGGAGTNRIFTVNTGQAVHLKNLTLTGGNGAGAANSGSGGAILNSGTLTVTECTFSGNSAGLVGGAIRNTGTLVANRSTFSLNSAATNGGAVGNEGSGSTASFMNCTFSGNSQTGSTLGGGAINHAFSATSMTLTHCTISGNSSTGSDGGGGIRNRGPLLTLENTIVAGNTISAGTGADLNHNTVAITANGANIVQSRSGTGTVTGILTNAAPRLAPLGNFGGPTRTRPLLPGSPAIDAATGSTDPSDQRGFARPNGPLPDIGAVEAYPFTSQGFVDADSDGIDDRLEPAYPQLTVGLDDSALDSDGDGSTDAEELRNMTDPDDSSDSFRILSFLPAAGFNPGTNPLFDITFSTFPGLDYSLEGSQSLTGFDFVSGSAVTASGFSEQMQVLLDSGRSFVRARRGIVRWASSVIGFSSQFDPVFWSAGQALGTPDTYPDYGDIATAWASQSENEPLEFLELGFDDPLPVSEVSIYETYHPGAVAKISVRNFNTGVWSEVWTGTAAPAPPVARIFKVTFPETGFPVDAVRIELDSDAVPGWNEIDAVSISR